MNNIAFDSFHFLVAQAVPQYLITGWPFKLPMRIVPAEFKLSMCCSTFILNMFFAAYHNVTRHQRRQRYYQRVNVKKGTTRAKRALSHLMCNAYWLFVVAATYGEGDCKLPAALLTVVPILTLIITAWLVLDFRNGFDKNSNWPEGEVGIDWHSIML